MTCHLCVVDLDVSNIGSVVGALRRVGLDPAVTRDPDLIAESAGIVLPGVGAFGDGMASLEALGALGPLRAAAAAGTPVIGICLGMQLLAERSEEHGSHAGIGLIPGDVIKLTPGRGGYRVPNVGWCDLRLTRTDGLMPPELDGTAVYFTHSYHVRCRDPRDVAATIAYGGEHVVVAVESRNVFGVQFHPEKSQDAGLSLLAALRARLEQRAVA